MFAMAVPCPWREHFVSLNGMTISVSFLIYLIHIYTRVSLSMYVGPYSPPHTSLFTMQRTDKPLSRNVRASMSLDLNPDMLAACQGLALGRILPSLNSSFCVIKIEVTPALWHARKSHIKNTSAVILVNYPLLSSVSCHWTDISCLGWRVDTDVSP